MKLPRLNISASAGSGKTFALSTHYIAMLMHGAPPESIFASTFTRKAASEILDRVLLRIALATRSDQAADDLAVHIRNITGHTVSLTPQRCADLLADLMRQLHRLGISTLDSFFVRTATCFSLELTLPPGWRIGAEMQQRQLAADAVDELLRQAEADDPQALVELVRQVNRGTADRSVHETLLSLFQSLHPIYQETAATSPEAWQSPLDIPPGKLDDAALERAIEALRQAELPTSKTGQPDGRFVKALAPVLDSARHGDWPRFLEAKLVTQLIASDRTYYKRPFPDSLTAALQTLLDHARAAVTEQLLEQRIALHRLLADYDHHYRILQTRRRAFRFDDVTRALGHAAALPDHQEIYYRLDATLQHLLLDEFQDTSLAQWRALEPLAAEILSHGDGSRGALIVADPKQSIYGWRGGEPELVHAVGKQFGLEDSTLHKSFRSSPVVLETVNAVCDELLQAPVLADHHQLVTDWLRAYKPHEAAFDLPGHARIHVAEAAENRHQQPQATIRRAAKLIRDLTTDAPGRSIGVLVRTNRAVRSLIHQLRQPDIGVDASEEGGNPLTDSPAVCAVLSLLKLADHPADTVCRFHVAATPLGRVVGLTNHADNATARRIANDVRRRLLVDGYGPTLHDLAERLAPHCDHRDLARLRQLVELGCAHEADATIRTRDFVTLVNTTRVEDVTTAAVRVMTVHQSKGLEFDIVVLPELDKPLSSSQPPALLVQREQPISPIASVFPGPTAAVRDALPQLKPLWQAHQYQQMRDALSTLYVALTRAKHALHMVIAPTAQKKTPSSPLTFATILRQTLADDAPAEPGDDAYYTAGDPDWARTLAAPAAGPADDGDAASAAPLNIRLRRPDRRDRTLPRRSPSSMYEQSSVDLNDVLRLESAPSRSIGSAVHALCEQIEWLDEPPDAPTLRAALDPIDVADPEAVLERFEKMIRQPEIAAALSRSAYAGAHAVVVKREHPFAVRMDDTIVQGFFDRLVLSMDATGRPIAADVLDYKTDRIDPDDADAIDQLVSRYEPQLRAYRRAAARLYHLPDTAITTRLLLMTPGRVVNV